MPPVIYKDHRGNRLPSVTTIIGRFKESGGLLYWANQQGLEGKTLDQARAEVTTPGTLAHKAVEDHINGRPETALTGAGEVTEKARNAYAAYLHWEAINRITFRHTEVSLASEQHAFGGTLDAVGMIETVWPGISDAAHHGVPNPPIRRHARPGFRSDDRAHLQGQGRARQVQGPGAQPHAAVSRPLAAPDRNRGDEQFEAFECAAHGCAACAAIIGS